MAEQIKDILKELMEKNQDSELTGNNYRQLLKDMNKIISEIRNRYYKSKITSEVQDDFKMSSVSELYEMNMQSIKDAEKRKDTMPLLTHYYRLDQLTGGFFKGEVIVIGGRPSQGKTTFALNLAKHFARMDKIPVAYFTLEQSAEYMYCRLLKQYLDVSFQKLYSGQINDEDIVTLEKIKDILDQMPIFFNNGAINSFEQLEMEIIQAISNNCKIVFIDYLQMMKSDFHFHNRDLELSYIMRRIKQIAIEYKVPFILFSQLNRSVEMRSGNKRPQLSDLRDSGEIEQVADKVFFLHRPESYGFIVDEEGNSLQGILELIIAKNKTGNTGEVRFLLNGDTGIIKEKENQESVYESFLFTRDSKRLGDLTDEDKPF